MSVNRAELFNKAKQERKKEKELESKRGGGNFSIFSDYVGLETDKFQLFRFLGVPIPYGEDDPYSPKKHVISMIAGDDDRKFRCIWPDRDEHPEWILWKIFTKVLAYDWDSESNTKIYRYAESHPSVFNRIRKNGNVQNTYESGWEPSKYVAWNVIAKDPTLYKWHQENKKTLIISKKASVSKDGSRVYYEPGVPPKLYNNIWDDVVEVSGDWEFYDIFVQKLKSDPWYKVYHAKDDLKKVIAKGNFSEEDLKEKGYDSTKSVESLTDEEQSWERHDLVKLFPITSYTKIYNRLKVTIDQIDKSFETHYLEELEDLKEKEAKSRKEESSDEETSGNQVPETEPKPVSVRGFTKEVDDKGIDESLEKEVKETPKRRTRPTPDAESKFDIDKIAKEKGFTGVDTLTERERSLITGYSEEEGTFLYDTKETVYECLNMDEGCTMQSPESFTHCPACGSKFT